jgi:hypothetical protein
MANGSYQTLRATAAVSHPVAEAAPTTTFTWPAAPRVIRSIEVRIGALATSGAPTHANLDLYIKRSGGVVVLWHRFVVPMSGDAISGTPPLAQFPDVYAEEATIRFAAFTAGTNPAVVSFTFQVAELG